MTRSQIEQLLKEAEINLRSYAHDEDFDLSELAEEIVLLEEALASGNYLDGEEQ